MMRSVQNIQGQNLGRKKRNGERNADNKIGTLLGIGSVPLGFVMLINCLRRTECSS